MALTQVTGPYPIFTDLDGTPLDDGYLYIGAINDDPETNPIQVYWDANLTIPASQPIRTNSGYAYRNGTPALLYTAGAFSITIRNKREEFVLYSPVGYGFDPAAVSASVVKNDFIGDGVTVDFVLSAAPSTILATNVFINGVYQEKDSYTLSGNTITFTVAPPLSSSIEVMTNETGIINSGNATAISYTLTAPGATAQTVQTKLDQYVSVKDFGAVGDGVADDTAALNAASSSGGRNVYIPDGDYLTTSTWNIPSGVSVEMSPNAEIIANHAGTAIFVNSDAVLQESLSFAFSVSRPSQNWSTGTDTTSIGVLISNTRYSYITIRKSANFRTGFVFRGDNTGTTGNTISIGSIRNNRFGIDFERIGAGGYNNQNTFIGGMIRVDSGLVNTVGYPTKLVNIASENGLSFIGVNMEGGAVLPSYCVDLQSGRSNTFTNCRFEAQGNGTFNIASGVIGATIIAGYNINNPSGGVVADAGTNTTIIGLLTSLLNGAQWKKRADHTNPTVQILASDGSIGFGDGAGTSAPVAVFRAENSITLGVRNRYMRIASTARLGGEVVSLTDGDTTIDLSVGGLYFKTANTGATNFTGVTGGIEGQMFFIRANDANTTLVNSASLRLTGGVNLTLASGQVVQFVCTSTAAACQV
jgi:hypothetical protein